MIVKKYEEIIIAKAMTKKIKNKNSNNEKYHSNSDDNGNRIKT